LPSVASRTGSEGGRGRQGGLGSSPSTLQEVGAPRRAAEEVGA